MNPFPVYIPAGSDRFQATHQAFGLKPIDFKVASEDTGGRLFVVEHTNARPGGPPRHVHHAQEELFYVLEGRYLIEVGEERYELHPGDCVLAPRGVPHGWACVAEYGRLLITFQPAGQMEAFFAESSGYDDVPPPEVLADLFARHEMTLTGPPLLP